MRSVWTLRYHHSTSILLSTPVGLEKSDVYFAFLPTYLHTLSLSLVILLSVVIRLRSRLGVRLNVGPTIIMSELLVRSMFERNRGHTKEQTTLCRFPYQSDADSFPVFYMETLYVCTARSRYLKSVCLVNFKGFKISYIINN